MHICLAKKFKSPNSTNLFNFNYLDSIDKLIDAKNYMFKIFRKHMGCGNGRQSKNILELWFTSRRT